MIANSFISHLTKPAHLSGCFSFVQLSEFSTSKEIKMNPIGFRAAACISFLIAIISTPLLADQVKDKQASDNLPDCVTKRVSEISNPSRETDFLVHVCGKEVATELVDKDTEADNTQSKPKQQREEAWMEARAWADLDAQKSMASSTFWIMLATVLGIGIGGFGLIYLIKTFEATKRTADAAEKAEGAFVDVQLVVEYLPRVEHPLIGPRPPEGHWTDRERFQIVPQITNYGRTPARDVTYEIASIYWNGDDHIVYRRGEGAFGVYCISKKPIDIMPNNIDSPMNLRITNDERAAVTYRTLETCKGMNASGANIGSVAFLVSWSYKTIFSDETIDGPEYIAHFRHMAGDEWEERSLSVNRPESVNTILSLYFEREKDGQYKYAK